MIKNFAIIKDGIVENVIAIEGDLIIQSDTAGRGDIYDPKTVTITRPVLPDNE